jgi:hypothetical protein
MGCLKINHNYTTDLKISWINNYVRSEKTTLKVHSNYLFGFNGQEKTDEIAGKGNHNTALFWEYDTRLGRRWNLDPKPTIGVSDYATFGNNPIWFFDVLGDTWFKDKDGSIQYSKTTLTKKDMKEGQTFLGESHSEKVNKKTNSYRTDGSILFGDEQSAYKRMNTETLKPGGGTNKHEILGLIGNDGVLVLPDYKNNSTTSETDGVGYKISNSKVIDPITKKTFSILGTIHTHPLKFELDPSSAGPSREDISVLTTKTPNKPFLSMGWDGKIHAAIGNKNEYKPIELPKGYNKVSDILNGASLIELLKQNK